MTDYTDLHRRLWQAVERCEGRLEADLRALLERVLAELRAGGEIITPAIERELAQYADRVDAVLRDGIEVAARLGGAGLSRPEIARLARAAFDARWPDGLTLSSRLWRFRADTRIGLADVLRQAAASGRAVSGLVYDLQRTIEARGARFQVVHTELDDWATLLADEARALLKTPTARDQWRRTVALVRDHLAKLSETGTAHAARVAFRNILDATAAGRAELLDEAVRWWLYDKQIFLLKRIARTEMATAQHRAVIASGRANGQVIGFHWRLSSSHPEPDICDYYAAIDQGLGKGVWRADQVPEHKAHPHCMCLLIPVVAPRAEPGSTNYAEFIRDVTPERRAQLLPQWAQQALNDGAELSALIRPDGFGLITRDAAQRAGLVASQSLT